MVSLKSISAIVLILSICSKGHGQSFDTTTATISKVLSAIQSRSITCSRLMEIYLYRVSTYNSQTRAVIYYNETTVKARAVFLDAFFLRNGTVYGQLHCVPLLVKDNYDISNIPTTNGASAMSNMIPSTDSDAVKKLVDAGAIVIGKTNMALMSDSGEFSKSEVGGNCSNPFGLDRTCYGSSGGTGAGLAADFGVIGLGTDTEGSVVGPASAGNAFGLRTVQITNGGTVSLQGIYPAFPKMDSVGPMARTAEDVIKVHEILLGTNRVTELMDANGMQGVNVTIFPQLFDAFNLSIPNMGNLAYKYDDQSKKLANQFIANLRSSGVNIFNKTFTETEMLTLIGQIITMGATKISCSSSCMAQSITQYFNRTAYPNGPFKEAKDLLNTTMPAYYKEKLNASLNRNQTLACSEQSSDDCKAFADQRAVIAATFTSLAGNNLLVVPTFPTMPHLNSATLGLPEQITVGFAFYTGDAALDIPVGFTDPLTNAPQGIPIGVLVQTKKENIDTLLKFGYAYNFKYPNRQAVQSMPNNAKSFLGSKILIALVLLVTYFRF